MEFRNFTPFPALAYQALDVQGKHHHVIAMRQTLRIGGDGSLRYADRQEPLAVEDTYFGEMNRSSVRQESDLVPFKPKCDVIVIATGYAPGGVPVPRFGVNVRITSATDPQHALLNKTLVVTGPRVWQKRGLLRRWTLSEPEPTLSLPIRYEYAYGGEQKIEGEHGHHTVVETNPVGRGFSEEWFRKANALDRLPAPQIESPDSPAIVFGQPLAVQGFGVITKAWLPRRKLAGTADEAFAKSDRWLPEDFDFAFWNGAHPNMQIPYLNGDEFVGLTNLTAQGRLRFQLPGNRPYVLVRQEDGEIRPAVLNLDTLIIDVEAGMISLVHRLWTPTEPAVRVFETRFVTTDEWNAATAQHERSSEPLAAH